MAEERKTIRLLTALIILLIAGIGFLGVQVNRLNKEVVQIRSTPKVQSAAPRIPVSQQAKGSALFPQRLNSFWNRNPLNDEWDPMAEMEEIREQMNKMFNDSFGRGLGNPQFDLETDVQATKDHYIVKMDVPGMNKSNINVEVRNNTLMVSGERREENEETRGDQLFHKERSFGYFSQMVPLPEDAQSDHIIADYNNGVLTVKVPRVEAKSAAAPKSAIKVHVN